MCLGMLYPIMEVFRNDDEFAEELSTCPFPVFPCTFCVFVKCGGLTFCFALPCLFAVSMEPPLPIYFFQMLANLKDRSAKSFPAKKVRPRSFAIECSLTPLFQLLLVTWKSVLACLGGQTELTRTKTVARELAGLSPLKQDGKTVSKPFSLFPHFITQCSSSRRPSTCKSSDRRHSSSTPPFRQRPYRRSPQ